MVFDASYYFNIYKGFEPENLEDIVGNSLKWEPIEIANSLAIYNESFMDKLLDIGEYMDPHHISAMNQVFTFLHLLDSYKKRKNPKLYNEMDKLSEKIAKIPIDNLT